MVGYHSGNYSAPTVAEGEDRLPGLYVDYLRPTGPGDIFRSNKRRASEVQEQRPRRFRREDITL